MKITFRTLHRDLGFFFVGLVIAFSVSGLFLNHRQDWHPMKYAYDTIETTVPSNFLSSDLSDEVVQSISENQKIDNKVRRFGTDEDLIWISYQDAELEYNSKTGIGKIKKFKITPVLGHMTKLHVSTSKFWIYYSDVFAIAMFLIAISAMVFAKGKHGFGKYGWKLMVAGLIFPLIFLFLL